MHMVVDGVYCCALVCYHCAAVVSDKLEAQVDKGGPNTKLTQSMIWKCDQFDNFENTSPRRKVEQRGGNGEGSAG